MSAVPTQTERSIAAQAPVEQLPAVISDTASLMAVIARAASDPNVDVDKMERLMAMKERADARAAEQAFNEAMRDVQAELPRIIKDAENKDNHSRYARLETIGKIIKPIISKHGFSQSFGTDASPLTDHYRVTCTLSHTGGHSREYFADVPRDMVGLKGNANKTPTHGFGSSMSYGRRYLTMLIFNLELAGEDDDGRAAGNGLVTDEQAEHLLDMIGREYTDEKERTTYLAAFLKWIRAESIIQIKATDYEKAVKAINEASVKRSQARNAKQ